MDEKTDSRPPIVTLMGHVDHGKTTLLDSIRKTNVVAHEAGGITQHIGAYQIEFKGKLITFVDTPGHAAFEKMRSRGAEVADIVVLVVAANDGIKPQTTEAIKHLTKAQRPTIVAITKVDLPDVNIEKVKKQLQDAGILIEEYGGDVPVVQVAAPKNQGVTELLEMIQLVWQMAPELSLPNEPLEAVVVESFINKNKGPVTTVIVKKGTLKVGQKILFDTESINVRALVDDRGQNVKEATPAKPVEILGFKKAVDVGTIILDQNISKAAPPLQLVDMATILKRVQDAKDKFKVIIKTDVLGSLEAILTNLPDKILVLSAGVGEVNETDVAFAKVSSSPILAFHSKVPPQIQAQAQREGVIIKQYKVIYELLTEMEDVAASFEEAKYELKIVGKAKIIATFAIDGKKIAGSKVTQGRLKVGDSIILRSESGKTAESKIVSLKKFKKDVETVSNGQDCGISFSPEVDFKEGDSIESIG